MIIKIENLKKSERGIEVIGWMPHADCGRIPVPDIRYNATKEQRAEQLSHYYAKLKEVNDEYDAAIREFERLHLGDAKLVQEEATEKNGNG
jgi:hypothetical protein